MATIISDTNHFEGKSTEQVSVPKAPLPWSFAFAEAPNPVIHTTASSPNNIYENPTEYVRLMRTGCCRKSMGVQYLNTKQQHFPNLVYIPM